MRLLARTGTAIALAAALSGCSLGGLLGGGGKPPTTLITLTPEAAAPAQISRNVPPPALGSTGRGFVRQRSPAEKTKVAASSAKTVAEPDAP